MAIEGNVIMANLTIKSIMAILAATLNDHKYKLCGCLKKEWPKWRSPVKTVMKKTDPMKSYDQDKKNCNFLTKSFVKLVIQRRVWHTWKKGSNLNKISPHGSSCPFTVPPALHLKNMEKLLFRDTLVYTLSPLSTKASPLC